MANNLDRAMAYLDKLPPAVSGSGGHNLTLRAACECVRFGLSDSDVLRALLAYNARCQPPWSEKELRHKLASARQKARAGEYGGQPRRGRPSTMFTPPAWKRPAPAVPVCKRAEAEEEQWWAAVFAERGIADPALETELIE